MSKLKFLFVQPDFNHRYIPFFPVYEPLHGLLLGAVAKEYVDTMIFDRRFDTDANLTRVVREFEPDVVAFTSHTAGEIYNIKRLSAIVKQERSQALTIVGGQHATLLPEDLFDTSMDVIVIGPGEETFYELMKTMKERGNMGDVDGIAIRQAEGYHFTSPRIVKNGEMSWPELDHSLVLPKYKKHYGFNFEQNRSNIYTITTSGCPYRCTFCSLWAAARGSFRYRTAEEIVHDIVRLPQTYVHLTDDNTFHKERHALDIYHLLKKANVKKKILAYARADTIVNRRDLIEKWKEIGLSALVVGMEAVTDKNLMSLNKNSSYQLNVEAQKVMDELRIENWAHFVVMPEFQKEDFDAIWDFVDSNNIIYPVFASYTPVAGTPLFFNVKQENKLTVFDYSYYNLQYQPLKTALPKDLWYKYYWDLYLKSSNMKTLMKRRKMNSFHFRPAFGRAHVMGARAAKVAWKNIKEQLDYESKVRYEDIEHTLLPSFRKDYVANKYYNSSTMHEFNSKNEENQKTLTIIGANR